MPAKDKEYQKRYYLTHRKPHVEPTKCWMKTLDSECRPEDVIHFSGKDIDEKRFKSYMKAIKHG